MSRVVLQGEDLILRPFQLNDAEALFANLQSDEQIALSSGQKPFSSIAESREWIKERLAYYDRAHFYDWAVILKKENELVGECCAAYSAQNRAADIGYAVGTKFQNRGLASQAVCLMLAYFTMQKITVYASCRKENAASRRVMEKTGMIPVDKVPDCFLEMDGREGLIWTMKKG